MPLEGLRWSRDSGSALYDTPQTAVLGRAGGGNLADLTPNIGNNISLLLLYAVFGVGFPLVFMWGFRIVKTLFEIKNRIR